MDDDITRRTLVGAILAGTAVGGALSPVGSYLRRFAPLSGEAWGPATDDTNGSVESEYGKATLRYDGEGVPNITAENERALYFAVGYAQARDRLFQLDLQRRLMRGQVSAVVGELAADSDEFHIRMDFARRGGSDVEPRFRHGNRRTRQGVFGGRERSHRERTAPAGVRPVGVRTGGVDPADTMLMEKQISWELTGSFLTLRKAKVASTLGPKAAKELYPERLDHDSPVIRGQDEGKSAKDVRPTPRTAFRTPTPSERHCSSGWETSSATTASGRTVGSCRGRTRRTGNRSWRTTRT